MSAKKSKVEKPVVAEDETKTHYTKSELLEFKEIIMGKLEESRKELKRLQESLQESNEMGSDSYNMTEFGSETLDKEQTEMFMAREAKFIGNLEKALIRIENGSYGRCRITGKLIPAKRLKIVPHTMLSLEGKQMIKKDQTLED
jgi:RNA polymerase-binding transcription factor DksA